MNISLIKIPVQKRMLVSHGYYRRTLGEPIQSNSLNGGESRNNARSAGIVRIMVIGTATVPSVTRDFVENNAIVVI